MKHIFLSLSLLLPLCCAAQVAGRIILQEGDPLAGGTVQNVNVPFINGNGQVGFTGTTLVGGVAQGFVWYDNGPIFLNSDLPADMLTGAEAFMGIGNNMEFIYSPSTRGDDAVYTHDGRLAVENTQGPGLPTGTNTTFHSRPRMTADGTSYWISGYNDGMGGTSSFGRIFYTATPAGVISPLLLGESTTIMGQTIDDGSAIDFDYGISDDAGNFINEVNFNTGSTADDSALILNGSSIIAQETNPTGDGDNWDNFDFMDINNNGDYVFSGDTDGAAGPDEFIAVNGTIVLREGATVDGVTLTGGQVLGLDLNNNGRLLHVWRANGTEYLLLGGITDLNSSQVLVAIGDQIDTNDDGTADVTLVDVNTFGSSVSLSDEGKIFLSADYREISSGNEFQGILELTDFALPVSYLSFTASLDETKAVELNWATASEENNLGFDVERASSSEPGRWQKIGTVAARGGHQSVADYDFVDYAPLPGVNLYRLRQIDYDGTFQFSSIVSVMLRAAANDLTLFPTVADKEISFRFTSSPDRAFDIEIHDMAGKRISDFSRYGNTITFSSAMPAGNYVVNIRAEGKNWVRRFVKR